MKIAVDAMGGDHAPESVVKGCLKALDTYADLEIILYGNDQMIKAYMDKKPDRLSIHHTDEKIESDDVPTRAVRRKKQASMVLAVQAVKNNEADAAVSAGNTGALMTAGLLIVGRTEGIERPALAPMLPTMDGSGFLLLDVGANMEAKPSHLLQYAQMGDVYMRNVRGIEKPRIGLLNVGDEAGKGTELTKAVYDLLASSGLNFVGNVEARELLDGPADVVVCDGFTGNIVLKTIEGTAMSLFGLIREELTSSLKTKLAAGVLKPSFKQIKSKMDYAEYGGAGLFGLNAPVIKAHGSSDAQAYFSALRQARTLVLEDVAETIKENAAMLKEKEDPVDE